jgi:putative peptide zinc metalloprotease protein
LPAGTKVAAGQTVAKLENLDVQLEVQRLRGARNQQRLHLQNLKRRQVDDPEAAALVPAAVESVADVEERLRQRLAEQGRLVLKSPIDGTILPPHELHPPASPGTLPFWSGTPLDEQNRRCYLESGTLVCSVGDPNQIEAVLAIDQSEIGLVRTGQQVRLQIDNLPGVFLIGSIAQISEMDLRVAPRSLAAGGDLPSRLDPGGLAHPRSTTYQARVELDPARQRVLLGATGRAKIAVDARSLGWRLWRFLSRTFRLEL